MGGKRDLDLNRRRFLQLSAAGGAGLWVSCAQNQEGSSPLATRSEDEFELAEVSLAELRQAYEEGRRTVESVTEAYLRRIEKIDPKLNSIIEVNPEALDIARRLDEERREGRVRGPLHGIPVVLKDNIDTADRMTTTAGSLALEGSIPPEDAFVARRLREAGAVLLAKANLSEWANFRSTRSSSGWSARGGQCRNPYVLDRNPCGSSSGSAAAVSANLCPVAVGTETNGSIVCPSTATGVVGVKPTLGRVSRSGIIPIAHSQDTAGPIARSVADAALLLAALSGVDPSDPMTEEPPGGSRLEFDLSLDPDSLRGARIGIARKFFGFHEKVDAIMESALETMREAGAELVDPADIPTHGEFNRPEFQVLLYEFKADIEKYLASLGPEIELRTLEDLILFNEEHAEQEMPYFGQEIFHMAQEKGPLSSPEYLEALESSKRLAGPEGIDLVMDRFQLDALVAPTGGPAWKTDLINGDHFLGGSSSPAAVSGYPSLTVPAGFVWELPVGISFFGRAWSEDKLLNLAYAYESLSGVRRAPRFLES